MKKQSKVVLIVIFILLINTITYANSAPTYWTDYPSAGIIAVDKNTPVKILNENLLFDFTKDYDDSYSPSANVTAEYEMENPSNESISVQMAFPFISRNNDNIADDIFITADDENIPYKLYMGDIVQESGYPFREPENTDFNIDTILKSITDKKYAANNFKGDETGKLYKFNVTSNDDKAYFAVTFNFNPEKTKIIFNGYNYFERDGSHIRIGSSIGEKRPMEIYVIGEDIDFDFKGYADGRLEEETDLIKYETFAEEKNVEAYLMDYTDSNLKNDISNISNISLYNIYAQSLDENLDKNSGICSEDDIMSQIRSARIMVLIYTVDFPENSKKNVSVRYNSKGTMDRRKTPEPQYTYDYILNPARNWKDFKNLNIKIIAPEEAPYIINSSIELKKDDNNIYTAYLEKLPEEDFFFTLYSKKKVSLSDSVQGYLNRNFGYFTPIVVVAAVLILLLLTIRIIRSIRGRNLI